VSKSEPVLAAQDAPRPAIGGSWELRKAFKELSNRASIQKNGVSREGSRRRDNTLLGLELGSYRDLAGTRAAEVRADGIGDEAKAG